MSVATCQNHCAAVLVSMGRREFMDLLGAVAWPFGARRVDHLWLRMTPLPRRIILSLLGTCGAATIADY